jgi:hypothetical protein
LDDYQTQARLSRYEQQPHESDQAYVQRMKGIIHRHLPAELPAGEMERVAASWNAAVERVEGGEQSHEELRAHLDGRDQGSGRGIFGAASPAERAAAYRAAPAGNSMSESPLAYNGALASQFGTPGQVAVPRVYASQIRRPNQQSQRVDVSQLRSTGSGFMGVDS